MDSLAIKYEYAAICATYLHVSLFKLCHSMVACSLQYARCGVAMPCNVYVLLSYIVSSNVSSKIRVAAIEAGLLSRGSDVWASKLT